MTAVSETTTRLVFDAQAWGGHDVGDNSQFWREAEIVERHFNDGDPIATVRFTHDGRISHGHFIRSMRSAGEENVDG